MIADLEHVLPPQLTCNAEFMPLTTVAVCLYCVSAAGQQNIVSGPVEGPLKSLGAINAVMWKGFLGNPKLGPRMIPKNVCLSDSCAPLIVVEFPDGFCSLNRSELCACLELKYNFSRD